MPRDCAADDQRAGGVSLVVDAELFEAHDAEGGCYEDTEEIASAG